MNNRQSGANTEIIKKEQAFQAKWERENERYRHYQADAQKGKPQYGHFGSPRSQYSDLSVGGRGYSREIDPQNIYDEATRISSPRLVNDDDFENQVVERKVVRQVEVPYTRQVKVPVRQQKIVPAKVLKKIKTTKLVEVPSYEYRDETYTEIVEQPAMRDKEVWVKKIVPEKYMEKVPVTRTRQVKVPTTVIQEVDDYEVVEVNGSRVEESDGYRIDEVEDTKLVEVEEYQKFRLRPEPEGPARVHDTHDIGYNEDNPRGRRVGSHTYDRYDPRVRDLPTDKAPTHTNYAPRGRPRSASRQRRKERERQLQQQHYANLSRPGSARSTYSAGREPKPLGIKLSNTAERNCVVVTAVSEGSVADQAGLRRGDSLTRVNNQPTRTLDEFRRVCKSTPGNLQITVRRSAATGGRKVMLTCVR